MRHLPSPRVLARFREGRHMSNDRQNVDPAQTSAVPSHPVSCQVYDALKFRCSNVNLDYIFLVRLPGKPKYWG